VKAIVKKKCGIEGSGQGMAMIVSYFNNVNLVPNPCEMCRRQIHPNCFYKNVFISLPSQPFLGHHLGIYIFFTMVFFKGCTLFLQLDCFGLEFTSFAIYSSAILIIEDDENHKLKSYLAGNSTRLKIIQ